ncbi:MAG: hypothetical protein DHS20C18_21450 [Saprospiraceae bacterium]|nr:MAG: hypothetical protein DHS20C18_21450 [Saprospiraceae bacterium]
MQHDKLEQYIQTNREAFDFGVPSLKVWAEIDSALEAKKGKVRHLRRVVGIAATVAFLLVSGGVIGSFFTKNTNATELASLETIDPELAKIEAYYQGQFNQKYKVLASVPHDESIDQDIEQIDASMEELRLALVNAPAGSQQRIVENLIRTYQLKVQVLERVLQRLQSGEDTITKPKDDEKKISI